MIRTRCRLGLGTKALRLHRSWGYVLGVLVGCFAFCSVILILKFTAVATIPVALAESISPEDVGSDKLDRLFARLQVVQSEEEAMPITAEIWTVWLRFGDAEIDEGMRSAVVAMNTQRFAVALAILDALVEKAPNFAEAWNKRATVHYLLGQHDRSLSDINRTLELEPRHFGALSGRALIFTAQENKVRALEAIEAALKINPYLKGAQDIIERNGCTYQPRRPI